MTKSDERAKFNAVDLGEITINLLSAHPSVSAKYAFMNTDTGVRYGAGTRMEWGPTVVEKLQELFNAMEQEICVHVFGDANVQTEVSAQDQREDRQSDEIPSL